MKIKQPEPFMFKGGKRAVLLLHGFTGHSADVRMLGRFLETKGYTSLGPIYRGHGKTPEDLLDGSAETWYADVVKAYQQLKQDGYDKIAVLGLSLGGVLSLKLATENPVVGVGTMCSPMFFDNETQLTKGFRYFASQYKQKEGKSSDVITEEVKALTKNAEPLFDSLASLINEVRGGLDHIYTPTLVIQAEDDQMINIASATEIYDHVECDIKEIHWYPDAGHAITLGPKRDEVHETVYRFLESLAWD
ncbi:carboxylesterase [Halolactibacillus halophilus]|uniref:Carboxylesterase n=1 Tax=Halolactibacillus halophilus TaxID=306540 RepID=A0A1I5MQZ1_9BACI|nr:alpha/beta fold hydrolase [Halolactibacillus halophilus]GEM01233.1 carboxylesterase [Halolactibacillus halophilus]SFP11998.1 carboxylesterase [Halolactibacillus halophilus]